LAATAHASRFKSFIILINTSLFFHQHVFAIVLEGYILKVNKEAHALLSIKQMSVRCSDRVIGLELLQKWLKI
jgi:hypothetical protein